MPHWAIVAVHGCWAADCGPPGKWNASCGQLREQAAECRRLATAGVDAEIARKINALADEYTAKAI